MKSFITPSHLSLEFLLLRKNKDEHTTASISLLNGLAFTMSGCAYNPYVALQAKLNTIVCHTALSQIATFRFSQTHASIGHGIGLDIGDTLGVTITWGVRKPWTSGQTTCPTNESCAVRDSQMKIFVTIEPYVSMGLDAYSSNYGGDYTLLTVTEESKK